MTFYEQLEKHLSVKQHVLVQDEDGDYCVFSHLTDSFGDWRISGWSFEEKWVTNNIASVCGYDRKFIDEAAEIEKWKIIQAFDIPTGRFQVGDKVLVSENAKELCEISDVFFNPPKEMFGKVCEIKEIFNTDYNVYTPDKSDWFTLPHSALSYPIETEENEQENTAAQEAIELLEKNGYVISKK